MKINPNAVTFHLYVAAIAWCLGVAFGPLCALALLCCGLLVLVVTE